jgi:hypothetical protein
VYKLAIDGALNRIKRRDPKFQSAFYIRFLAKAWSFYHYRFPYYELLNVVFVSSSVVRFFFSSLSLKIT